MKESMSMKKKLTQARARQIGEGKNKAIIDRGRMINDGKNMKSRMMAKKSPRK